MRHDNKGFGVIEILLVVILIAIMAGSCSRTVKAEEYEKVKLTCYCPESCPGTMTATGARIREGIIASNREHLGDGAMIYYMDGTFMGFYECLDTGGAKSLKDGTAIDMWAPDLDKAWDIVRATGGEVMICWIKQPKG